MTQQLLGRTPNVTPLPTREESDQIMSSIIPLDMVLRPAPVLKRPWYHGREDEEWISKDYLLDQVIDEAALKLATEFSGKMNLIGPEAIVRAFRLVGSPVVSARSNDGKVVVELNHSEDHFPVSIVDVKTLAEEKHIHLTS